MSAMKTIFTDTMGACYDKYGDKQVNDLITRIRRFRSMFHRYIHTTYESSALCLLNFSAILEKDKKAIKLFKNMLKEEENMWFISSFYIKFTPTMNVIESTRDVKMPCASYEVMYELLHAKIRQNVCGFKTYNQYKLQHRMLKALYGTEVYEEFYNYLLKRHKNDSKTIKEIQSIDMENKIGGK